MTKDEYRALTKIRDESEAQELLTKTNMLFVATFTLMFVLRVSVHLLPTNGLVFPYLGYVALLVYFVYHCSCVIKLTRPVTKAETIWAIIFAPISWIWFYPALVSPLKIIVGIIEPPTALELPKVLSEEERQQSKKRIRRNTWRTIGLATLISFGIMVLMVVVITVLEGLS